MTLTIERPVSADPNEFQARPPAASGGKALFGDSGPSFGDLLDIVNPLQHLPLVGTIYRALTGDAISDGARLAGGALYGGPVGLAVAMANLGVREAAGRDLGEMALAALTGEEAAVDAPAQVAAAAPQPAEPSPAEVAPAPQAAAQATPQLSPEAFDALLRSVNQPTQAPAASAQASLAQAAKRPTAWSRPGLHAQAPVAMPPAVRAAARLGPTAVSPAALDALAGGPAAVPAMAPGARQASLELHDALRAYAQQKGVAPLR